MATTPPPPLSHSTPTTPPPATEAIMPALEHVKKVLFSPFDWRKWAALAFIALLAGVMSNGSGGNFGGSGDFGGGQSGASMDNAGQQAMEWLRAHTQEAIVAGIGLVLLWLAFVLLMLYISSVFRFIFLDSVVTDKIAIRRQWRRNKAEGIAYMWWRLGFFFVALLGFVVLVGIPAGGCALMIVRAVQGGTPALWIGAVLVGLLALLLLFMWAIATAVASALTRDFVLPIMYLERVGTMDAWREFWPILLGNKMGFFIYFLLKFVCAMAGGIGGLLAVVVALIVAAIPMGALVGIGYLLVLLLHITAWSWWYLLALVPVGIAVALGLAYWLTCVLLPIPVFFQSYALKYLGAVDPELRTI